MKILLISPECYGGRGGIALYNRDLVEALCDIEEITNVTVISRNVVDGNFVLPQKAKQVNNRSLSVLKFSLMLLKIILTNKFDFIIIGHINFLLFTSFVRLFFRTKLCLFIYGVEVFNRSEPKSYYVNKVDFVVSISDFTKEKFLTSYSEFNKDIYILPNCIREKEYYQKLYSSDEIPGLITKNRDVLFTLGRLDAKEKYKGIDEVLEVLASLKSDIPRILYVIGGAGNDKSRLEKKVIELGLQDYVFFTGYLSEGQKNFLFSNSKCFILAGFGEGFGFVILEALVFGLNAIGSRIDGTREALLHGALGTLVDPRNALELKNAIITNLKCDFHRSEEISFYYYNNFRQKLSIILRNA